DAFVGEAVEEDEVARLQIGALDGLTESVLRRRVVRQGDPDLLEDVAREARAVEACGRRATPEIGNSEVAQSDAHDPTVRRGSSRSRPTGWQAHGAGSGRSGGSLQIGCGGGRRGCRRQSPL